MKPKANLSPRVRQLSGATSARQLRELPGIGPKMEQALLKLGIAHPKDLINANPSAMYEKWMVQNGMKERCVLYVFRCAVYCAKTSADKRDPELTKWWNWKD